MEKERSAAISSLISLDLMTEGKELFSHEVESRQKLFSERLSS